MTNTLLAVDGNSLVHRSFHALVGSNLRTSDGRPSWAVKGFCSQLIGVIDRIGPDAIVVGFDDSGNSSRKRTWPHYKATRKPKPPELGQQIAGTIDFLRQAGVHVVVPEGLEADDVLASAARTAAAAGWQTVIVTSDRDSFALIDDTTRVLRIINGGVEASPLLSPKSLFSMSGIHPGQYREYAAMRGDTSDNLTGIPGVGEKTAAKLLAAFGTVEAAFADVDAGGERAAKELGKAMAAKLAVPENRDAFAQNVAIMTMHADLDLGLNLAGTSPALLPLPEGPVREAVATWELKSLERVAVAALSGPRPAPSQARPDVAAPEPVPAPEMYNGEIPLPPEPVDEYRPSTRPARELVTAAATPNAFPGSTAPRPSTWDDTLF